MVVDRIIRTTNAIVVEHMFAYLTWFGKAKDTVIFYILVLTDNIKLGTLEIGLGPYLEHGIHLCVGTHAPISLSLRKVCVVFHEGVGVSLVIANAHDRPTTNKDGTQVIFLVTIIMVLGVLQGDPKKLIHVSIILHSCCLSSVECYPSNVANKVKIGMLCTFKSRKNEFWKGYRLAPNNEDKKRFFDNSNPIIQLRKPLVTLLEKKAGKYLSFWISYSKVLGVAETGEPIIVWILSDNLKPVNHRNSQSKDL